MAEVVKKVIDQAHGALQQIEQALPTLPDYEVARALAGLTSANEALARVLRTIDTSSQNTALKDFANGLYEAGTLNKPLGDALPAGKIAIGLEKLYETMRDNELDLKTFREALRQSGLMGEDSTPQIRPRYLLGLPDRLIEAGCIERRVEGTKPFYRLTKTVLDLFKPSEDQVLNNL